MGIKEISAQKILRLRHLEQLGKATIHLPASKSESNRMLILNALSGFRSTLLNISEARDTVTMQRLLESDEHTLNVLDAGTTMRFLTAYLSVKNEDRVLTGTPRMCERPIKILVDALRQLGAEIAYVKEEGFPPVHLKSFQQSSNHIHIRGDVSSQYISALLMVAPVLPDGLTLTLDGTIGSRPYIEMTLKLMEKFGIEATWAENEISVRKQDLKTITHHVESDWSGASYWFSIVAMSDEANIRLTNLRKDSLQGDIRIAGIMEQLGVRTQFDREGLNIRKESHFIQPDGIRLDFKDCPDLAQTVSVTCAALGVKCHMSGLESLRIKETDRILALQNELSKMGARLTASGNAWELIPGPDVMPESLYINTYDDHRMAMAFAPLALRTNLTIEDPAVVQKSYPGFWNDLEKAGVTIEPVRE